MKRIKMYPVFYTRFKLVWNLVPATGKGLIKLKQKAQRVGAWFKVLKREERSYLELVMKVVKRIRSERLKALLSTILIKLFRFMGSLAGDLPYAVQKIGVILTAKLSLLAQSWGYKEASSWVEDRAYQLYLTIMHLNGS